MEVQLRELDRWHSNLHQWDYLLIRTLEEQLHLEILEVSIKQQVEPGEGVRSRNTAAIKITPANRAPFKCAFLQVNIAFSPSAILRSPVAELPAIDSAGGNQEEFHEDIPPCEVR